MAAINLKSSITTALYLGLAVVAVIPIQAIALITDSKAPITIEADYAQRNELNGTMLYRGEVIIRQGDLLIEADQVELLSRAGELEQIISTGQLARYTQSQSAGQPAIVAEAEQIDYLPGSNSITLLRNATLSRDGTLLKGEKIDYDFDSQSWQASGDESNSNQSQNGRRIQLVIPANDGDSSSEEQP